VNDVIWTGKRPLKRGKTQRLTGPGPLELFYAGIGYLGVFYESQLIYFKHQLETKDASGSDDTLIRSLEALQGFLVNLVADRPARVPLKQAMWELMEANRPAIRQLASEGRELVQRVEEERRKR